MARVLIVDDEPLVLEMLCDVLEGAGHEVAGVGHPNVVFRLNAVSPPDVYLIDLMLPGMNGLELASQLQALSDINTPMIAMSASSGLLREAAASGLFQTTLQKPFDVDEILACVDTCNCGAGRRASIPGA